MGRAISRQASAWRESEPAVTPGFDRTAIRDAIQRHLATRPNAKDSVRGVAEWCRAALGQAPSGPLVEEILEQLERQGRVASSILVDGTRVYHAPAFP
jgi:hypothetical protein